jgi:hypothetical protein
MSSESWKKVVKYLLVAAVIASVVLFCYIVFLFDQSTKQSERHDFHYSIDFSGTKTIENVTMLLPAPELNGTPVLADMQMQGAWYGVPNGWNLSIEELNGTPILAIRAARIVPEYHGYPIAIQPGQNPLTPTLVPGSEYSADTPVLQPFNLGMMLQVNRTIDTRNPVGNEPVFAPHGVFTVAAAPIPEYQGRWYTHTVPLSVGFTSDGPLKLSIRISIRGTNSIWRGGWVFNSYEDTVTLEVEESPGWIDGTGVLHTEEGV